MPDQDHRPLITRNWRGGGQNYLRCECKRLGTISADDGLLASWEGHLESAAAGGPRFATLDHMLQAATITTDVPIGRPTRGPRPGSLAGSGGGSPAVTGTLPGEVLHILWEQIWSPAALGTGLDPRRLASGGYTQEPNLVGRRYLALVFCSLLPRASMKGLAAEMDSLVGEFRTAARQLPVYLRAVPDVTAVAAEITRMTGIELPTTLRDLAGVDRPSGNSGPRLEPARWDRAHALLVAMEMVATDRRAAGAEMPKRNHASALSVALAAVAASNGNYDVMRSHELKCALATEILVSWGSVYRAVRLAPDKLAQQPGLAALTNAVLTQLADDGLTLTLPTRWQDAIRSAMAKT
jgi:hypothetical protein